MECFVRGSAISDKVVTLAAALSAASLHEAAGKAGALPARLKPIDPRMRLCGRALPVRCAPGDNLRIHHALAVAESGDVLVVDTGEGLEFGYWGEIMATAAMKRGLAGLVIDGGVRDTRRLVALGLPTFSACICIRGTAKDAASEGSVGEPVRIGDVTVRKGALVVGDADGVVLVAAESAAAVVEAAWRRDADEVGILDRIRLGALTRDLYDLA